MAWPFPLKQQASKTAYSSDKWKVSRPVASSKEGPAGSCSDPTEKSVQERSMPHARDNAILASKDRHNTLVQIFGSCSSPEYVAKATNCQATNCQSDYMASCSRSCILPRPGHHLSRRWKINVSSDFVLMTRSA
jgi:hypothetical protein